jgi:hypothetical protein
MEVKPTVTGMPGRPPTLIRNFPRPGGSTSPPPESHAGGSCQEMSFCCSCLESGIAAVYQYLRHATLE